MKVLAGENMNKNLDKIRLDDGNIVADPRCEATKIDEYFISVQNGVEHHNVCNMASIDIVN